MRSTTFLGHQTKVYRCYKRVRAKRDAAEVGPKGPDMVDVLQGGHDFIILIFRTVVLRFTGFLVVGLCASSFLGAVVITTFNVSGRLTGMSSVFFSVLGSFMGAYDMTRIACATDHVTMLVSELLDPSYAVTGT